jgi:hypothetical protein
MLEFVFCEKIKWNAVLTGSLKQVREDFHELAMLVFCLVGYVFVSADIFLKFHDLCIYLAAVQGRNLVAHLTKISPLNHLGILSSDGPWSKRCCHLFLARIADITGA